MPPYNTFGSTPSVGALPFYSDVCTTDNTNNFPLNLLTLSLILEFTHTIQKKVPYMNSKNLQFPYLPGNNQ